MNVGDKVIEIYGRRQFGRIREIKKKYVNGNVILDGSSQQYRVWHSHLHATGHVSRFSSSYILLTSEIEAEVAVYQDREMKKTALSNIAREFERIVTHGTDEEINKAYTELKR